MRCRVCKQITTDVMNHGRNAQDTVVIKYCRYCGTLYSGTCLNLGVKISYDESREDKSFVEAGVLYFYTTSVATDEYINDIEELKRLDKLDGGKYED